MAPDERHTTAAEDRVPWNQLIAYGMGGVIPIALFNIAGQLMTLLGNISLGLSALWLGAIMFVPRLWEAFSDPIVGHLSDNTRSRWGRRRPFILIGGIAVAVSFVAMWWVPSGDWIRSVFPNESVYNWFQLFYILGGLLAFFTACAVFEIPHGALGLEMSADYHERTRLFSAKSFLGNLFAMGTPALFLLAGLKIFSGPGGNHVDGMKYISMLIAVILIPLTVWWFFALREPGFAVAREQKKSAFWHDMRTTAGNRTFISLTAIVFTLATGFNFVSSLGNYITIFYLYGGNTRSNSAGYLMFVTGLVWAITGLVAVFPLNWLSKRVGKKKTLLVAILLMCGAQLAKIICYRPGSLFQFSLPEGLLPNEFSTVTIQGPYLILFPTVLLSAGMLMFFTLGASMVGDVCDEDELRTGTRSEGTYFSVFWWFIKVGTAFASLVAGALLLYSNFDERQNVAVDALSGSVAVMKTEAELWLTQEENAETRLANFVQRVDDIAASADKLRAHFVRRREQYPDQVIHVESLLAHVDSIDTEVKSLRANSIGLVATPEEVVRKSDELLNKSDLLKQQSPKTLFRLRLVEIGLPLALSVASILLTLRYPLTEARCYEIKELLKQRREAGTAH